MNNQRQIVTYGQTSGQGMYSAPNGYKQTGPKVAGNDRYDNYGGNYGGDGGYQGNQGYQYGGEEKHHHGCCAKMCACLAASICCCCAYECLT